MAEDPMAAEPLLARPRDHVTFTDHCIEATDHFTSRFRSLRGHGREWLSSRGKHYATMTLVTLDVAALLLNVFIQLIACDMKQRDEPWVEATIQGLEIAGLVFSCLFMVELLASLFSFGPRYLTTWFHIFDSVIIILSFLVDVTTTGFVADIGGLLVALRLWRLAKLSEEIVAGASERIDDLEQRNQELSDEIKELREQLDMS